MDSVEVRTLDHRSVSCCEIVAGIAVQRSAKTLKALATRCIDRHRKLYRVAAAREHLHAVVTIGAQDQVLSAQEPDDSSCSSDVERADTQINRRSVNQQLGRAPTVYAESMAAAEANADR